MLAGLRPIAGFRAAVAADEGEYEDEAKNRNGRRGMVHFPLASHSLGLRGSARSAPAGVRHGCLRDMTHKRPGPCDVSSAITASPSTNLSVKALDFVEWWALWDSNPGPTD